VYLTIQSKKFTFSTLMRPKMFVYTLHPSVTLAYDVKCKQTFLVSLMLKRWIFCSVWWGSFKICSLGKEKKFCDFCLLILEQNWLYPLVEYWNWPKNLKRALYNSLVPYLISIKSYRNSCITYAFWPQSSQDISTI